MKVYELIHALEFYENNIEVQIIIPEPMFVEGDCKFEITGFAVIKVEPGILYLITADPH